VSFKKPTSRTPHSMARSSARCPAVNSQCWLTLVSTARQWPRQCFGEKPSRLRRRRTHWRLPSGRDSTRALQPSFSEGPRETQTRSANFSQCASTYRSCGAAQHIGPSRQWCGSPGAKIPVVPGSPWAPEPDAGSSTLPLPEPAGHGCCRSLQFRPDADSPLLEYSLGCSPT
jgi:hypothetical protein